MSDWLGVESTLERKRSYMPKRAYMEFEKAREYVRGLNLKSRTEWEKYYKWSPGKKSRLPGCIPTNPNVVYDSPPWVNWGDWLGTGNIHPREKEYLDFSSARDFARKLKLKSLKEWQAYCGGRLPNSPSRPLNVPVGPDKKYAKVGWSGWGDWLGTGNISRHNRTYMDFGSARAFVRTLGLKSQREWNDYCKGLTPSLQPKPSDIPADPNQKYKGRGWSGMPDWLGNNV
jgi:hypothetical protein